LFILVLMYVQDVHTWRRQSRSILHVKLDWAKHDRSYTLNLTAPITIDLTR